MHGAIVKLIARRDAVILPLHLHELIKIAAAIRALLWLLLLRVALLWLQWVTLLLRILLLLLLSRLLLLLRLAAKAILREDRR
ncbi:MAG: hypothetical protein DHS20C04_18020 [Hyphococcus sp.]|nr:MAG: hypothetical protein DHS20C04_18020 [Marinicaulis sp.]